MYVSQTFPNFNIRNYGFQRQFLFLRCKLCKLCFPYIYSHAAFLTHFNENPSLRAAAWNLHAQASEHSSFIFDQFKRRPNFASTFQTNGAIRYPSKCTLGPIARAGCFGVPRWLSPRYYKRRASPNDGWYDAPREAGANLILARRRCEPLEYHPMQISRTNRSSPGTSCVRARLVGPRCFVLSMLPQKSPGSLAI